MEGEFGKGGYGGDGTGGALIFDGATDDSPGDGVDARDGDSYHVAAEDESLGELTGQLGRPCSPRPLRRWLEWGRAQLRAWRRP